MSSDDRLLLDYMALLRHLSLDLKLRLIASLTESIRESELSPPKQDNDDWKALFGVWNDVDEDLAEQIKKNRLPNRHGDQQRKAFQ